MQCSGAVQHPRTRRALFLEGDPFRLRTISVFLWLILNTKDQPQKKSEHIFGGSSGNYPHSIVAAPRRVSFTKLCEERDPPFGPPFEDPPFGCFGEFFELSWQCSPQSQNIFLKTDLGKITQALGHSQNAQFLKEYQKYEVEVENGKQTKPKKKDQTLEFPPRESRIVFKCPTDIGKIDALESQTLIWTP